MPTITFKLPLATSKFPFLYAKASAGVVIAGADVANRTPLSLYGSQENIDYNIVQPLFVENLWPTDTGFSSVGFNAIVQDQVGTTWDRAIVFRNQLNQYAIFSPANGANYVYRPSYGGWLQPRTIAGSSPPKLVTHAAVAGRNFVFYAQQDLAEWDFGLDSFVARVFTYPAGVSLTNIKGICGAGNYLIAFGDETIYWSSLTNPLDLANTAGGAGRQIPNQLRGTIRTVVPAADGFIIYTAVNAVAAFATNDATRPWTFREIKDAGGIDDPEQITSDSQATAQFTVGLFGIQQVTTQRAETVLPDAADFLVSRHVEFWNWTENRIDQQVTELTVHPKINFLLNRWLFLSYGWKNGAYAAALVYDTQLRRWGKLVYPHVDVAHVPGLTAATNFDASMTAWDYGTEPVGAGLNFHRESIVLLNRNGRLAQVAVGGVVLDPAFDLENRYNNKGVLVVGHCQLRRGSMLTLQKVEVQGAAPPGTNSDLTVRWVPRLGDQDHFTSPYAANLTESTATATNLRGPLQRRNFVGRRTADSFDLAIIGRLEINNLIAEVTEHGSR